MTRANESPVAGDNGAEGNCSGKNGSSLNNQNRPSPQASAWKRAAVETLLVLRSKYPQCFQRLDLPRRQPLKIGIHKDIIAALPELSPVNIGRGLKLYVSHFKYLEQCVEGRHRIDLNGQPAGVITAEEAKHCKQTIVGVLKKRQKIKPRTAEVAATPTPTPPPKKLSLQDLREAAAARKRTVITGGAS